MNKTVQKRLTRLKKELTRPDVPGLVARRDDVDGPIEWNGETFDNEKALDRKIREMGFITEKPVVIITREGFEENIH